MRATADMCYLGYLTDDSAFGPLHTFLSLSSQFHASKVEKTSLPSNNYPVQFSTVEVCLVSAVDHFIMSPALVTDSSPANGVHKSATSNGTIATPLCNPSLQVTADHRLKQVEAPVYAPQGGEVLLHIKATGVCG